MMAAHGDKMVFLGGGKENDTLPDKRDEDIYSSMSTWSSDRRGRTKAVGSGSMPDPLGSNK